MKKIVSMVIALVLLCAIPLSGMAAGTAHVISSEWNNETREKNH